MKIVHPRAHCTCATDYRNVAMSYYQSAKQYRNATTSENGIMISYTDVVFYNLTHSIELTLKAYMISQGWDTDDLRRKFGHNLFKLFKKARAIGLQLPTTNNGGDIEIIKWLSDNYIENRYPLVGEREAVLPKNVCDLADRLLNTVIPICDKVPFIKPRPLEISKWENLKTWFKMRWYYLTV